jgi:hypothetical protein
MTPDDNTRALVRRAGDSVPVGPAPVEELLRKGQGARRRRTRTTIGAVAAAVVVVTSGAVAVGSQLSNDATISPTVSTPRPDTGTLTPPPGMRYVGRNGIAVAIPASWRMDGKVCEGALIVWQVPTAYEGPMCTPKVRIRGDLRISSYDAPARFFAPYTHPRSIGAHQVAEYGPEDACAHTDGFCVLEHRFVGALLSRSQDVVIVVSSESRAEVSQVLASAFALPDGYTAIPAEADPSTLLNLGLAVRHITRSAPRLPPNVLGIFPQPGSVVGSHSVVSVVTGPPSPTTSACAGLRLDIATLHRTIPIVSDRSRYEIVVHRQEIVRLEAVGRCADSVGFTSADRHILSQRFKYELFAVRPGIADVTISIPMCAGSGSTCGGGIATLAHLKVHILP